MVHTYSLSATGSKTIIEDRDLLPFSVDGLGFGLGFRGFFAIDLSDCLQADPKVNFKMCISKDSVILFFNLHRRYHSSSMKSHLSKHQKTTDES